MNNLHSSDYTSSYGNRPQSFTHISRLQQMTSSSAAPPTTTKTPGTGPAVTATTTIAGGAPTSNPAAAAAVAATSQATPALITTPQSKFKKGGGGHIGDSPIPKIEIDKKGKGRDEYSNSSLNSANSDIIPANLPPRRVWVRKANGNPTTIFACVNDIVDDLKSAVIAKYPNSIGRFDDAADLVIKIDLGNLKTPVSPSMNRVSNNNNRTYENQLVVLEPDQNVWHVLDHYYPNGMCMNEALIVDTSTFTPDSQAQPPTPISAVPNLHSHSNGGSIGGAGDRHLSMVGYNFNRAQGVKHPQPIQPNNPRMTNYKVYPMTRANHSGNNINKDRSVSPSALVSRNSPVSHKRSYSNPVYSPVSNFMQPQQSQQSQLQSQAQQQQGNNPSAVLLLPKNFSLANNTNNNNTHKTRLSEDGMAATINENSAQEDEGEEDQDEEEKEFAEKEDGKVEEDFDEQRRGNKSSKSKHKPAPLPLTKLSSNVNNNSNNSIAGTPKSSDSTTDKVLPSISVLVVEDNAINQAILGAFLRKRKIHYKIAKNGQEAIDKWKQGGYHLVLMDIQLPVKSGIEATKEIRHLEKLNKIGVFDKNELNNTKEVEDKDKLDNKVFRSPVIIVALTASSNSSIDKKNALTAGCNDYLTKPVNLVWLQNKITEWGCMQALIDFDGWKDKNRRLNKT